MPDVIDVAEAARPRCDCGLCVIGKAISDWCETLTPRERQALLAILRDPATWRGGVARQGCV